MSRKWAWLTIVTGVAWLCLAWLFLSGRAFVLAFVGLGVVEIVFWLVVVPRIEADR